MIKCPRAGWKQQDKKYVIQKDRKAWEETEEEYFWEDRARRRDWLSR
jgi:hypothetical protein